MDSFSELHRMCERAAKLTHYPLVIEQLHRDLDHEYWDLGEATLRFFLPVAILDLETKLERREALDSIPDTDLRTFVENGIMAIWERRGKATD